MAGIASNIPFLLLATLCFLYNAHAILFEHPGGGLIGPATIVVGDHLYIDGGEFTNGNGNLYGALNQETLAVSLKTSWNARTVRATQLSTDCPKAEEYLFYSPTKEALYRWGGRATFDYCSTNTDNLQFLPLRGAINPQWGLAGDQPPSNIKTPLRATWVRTPGSLYLLSGITDSNYNKASVMPGLVRYDIRTRKWSNSSSQADIQHSAWQGAGVYVPSFGDEGIIVFLGGIDPTKPVKTTHPQNPVVSMARISIYDISSGRFFYQTATASTGDVPRGRYAFCAVGAEDSDSGEFDIFMYGGNFRGGSIHPSERIDGSSVWVLSLPSFQWQRAVGSPSGNRLSFYHSCEVIGGRQMAVIGGAPGYYHHPERNFSAGPFLFDMTKLQWRASYNPHLGPYARSPLLARNAQKKPTPAQWDSSELKNIFDPNDDSSNVGVIAGATVGGVVGIALVCVAVYCFFRQRRKKKKKKKKSVETDKVMEHETSTPQDPGYTPYRDQFYKAPATYTTGTSDVATETNQGPLSSSFTESNTEVTQPSHQPEYMQPPSPMVLSHGPSAAATPTGPSTTAASPTVAPRELSGPGSANTPELSGATANGGAATGGTASNTVSELPAEQENQHVEPDRDRWVPQAEGRY